MCVALARMHNINTLAIGGIGAQAYNQMRRNSIYSAPTKVLLSDFSKSSGFKAARKEYMGSSTRKPAVAAPSDKRHKYWDFTFSLDYAGGTSKEILVHTQIKSMAEQRDTWHALVMEMDALQLSCWLVAFILERNVPVVTFASRVCKERCSGTAGPCQCCCGCVWYVFSSEGTEENPAICCQHG